jgi:hypothetical protein
MNTPAFPFYDSAEHCGGEPISKEMASLQRGSYEFHFKLQQYF